MVKSFRFLLGYSWVNLGAVFGFAAIVIAGCYVTGVPDDPNAGNIFETYYAMFPAVEEDEATGEPRDVDADDEEYGLVIMKGIQENGEELLSTLDSDEELDEVYELFMERFFQDEEE